MLTTIQSVDPAANSHAASPGTDISATFDQDVVAATATPQNIVVHGSVSQGQVVGTVFAAGPVITHNPTRDFAAGEVVQVTATAGISTAGGAANKRVWQFRTSAGGSGQLADTGQTLPTAAAAYVSLGDIDGDGDSDAILGNSGAVLVNDGTGFFTDSGQALTPGGDLELADIDGDGDLDVVGTNEVWSNNGIGLFSDTAQALGGGTTVAVGDLDGDGDLDAMVGIAYTSNRVFFNDGNGNFTNSGQTGLGTASPASIEFGDLDGDGDLDAFKANNGIADRVWFNDGYGTFTDSGQQMGGFQASQDMELGDLDGDGDLDAFVVNEQGADSVWLNDGSGVFANSGQSIGNHRSFGVALGDLDGDGDLDAFESNSWALNLNQIDSIIWLNDGGGNFSDSGQRFAPFFNYFSAIADLDRDGDLDVFMATNSQPQRVLLNQNLTPNVTLGADNTTITENLGTATITATLSAAHSATVTIDLGTSGSATGTDDYTISGTQIMIPAGSTSGSVTVTAVQDTVDDDDETVIVDITGVTNAQETGTQQVTITIIDDDEAIPVPDVTLSVDNVAIPEASGVATFTANLSVATTVPVTIDLGLSGTAAATDFNASGTQIMVAPGATTGSITVTAVQDTLDEPNETVIVDVAAVTGGTEVGTQQQTTTITDDDDPTGFMVSSLLPTSSGFVAELSTDVDVSVLNLYGLSLGEPDAVLTGTASGPVAGSLVVDASLRRVSFIKTGDPLLADTYTVRLRSADDAFKDLAGNLLDGDGNGTAGDDFVDSFTVAPPAAGAVALAVPDFVRGAGQDVNLPADMTSGIPVSISVGEGTSVRAVDVRISYNPALLDITAATVGAEMPAGASAVVNTNTPGLAIVVFFSTAPLPVGTNTLVNLQASVPTTNASENYGSGQVLDIHSIVVSDGQDNESPVIADDAIHLASYFADVSGNGRINASDASQVARFAALLESGFAGSPLTDPIILGDISGNGRINAADASLLAQFAALIPVAEIPPIPVGVVVTGGGGFGRLPLLQPPQEPHEETGNNLEGRSTTITGWNTLPDYYPAIETFMRGLAEPAGGSADEKVHMPLEEVIDQLFSALDLVPSG